jgi:hypothetical protein
MMTAVEAAAKPYVVRAIASKAGADKRTVLRCLNGQSPCSKVWDKVGEVAAALGVESLPEPPVRKPRPAKECPECAKLRAEIAALKRALEASPRKLAVVPAAPPVTPEHATG